MSLFGIDLESLLSQANANQTQGGASGVNRGPPAVAPTIPIPANQNPNATGYMGQAFRLANVPVVDQSVTSQSLPPAQQQSFLDSLRGYTSSLGGQMGDPQLQYILAMLSNNGQGGGMNPLYAYQILQSLQGNQ